MANLAAVLKQKEIKRKLGVELLKDLRYATITSFSWFYISKKPIFCN